MEPGDVPRLSDTAWSAVSVVDTVAPAVNVHRFNLELFWAMRDRMMDWFDQHSATGCQDRERHEFSFTAQGEAAVRALLSSDQEERIASAAEVLSMGWPYPRASFGVTCTAGTTRPVECEGHFFRLEGDCAGRWEGSDEEVEDLFGRLVGKSSVSVKIEDLHRLCREGKGGVGATVTCFSKREKTKTCEVDLSDRVQSAVFGTIVARQESSASFKSGEGDIETQTRLYFDAIPVSGAREAKTTFRFTGFHDESAVHRKRGTKPPFYANVVKFLAQHDIKCVTSRQSPPWSAKIGIGDSSPVFTTTCRYEKGSGKPKSWFW